MNHMKDSWKMEMEEIKKIVSPGDAKVLTRHVFEMLEKRNMSLIDLGLVLLSGEIILGLDYHEKCNKAYVKNVPGIHRLVLGKNSKQEDVIVSLEIEYKGNVPVVEKVITIYSLNEEINENDPRKSRVLQIREYLQGLFSVNHTFYDTQYRDEQGRRVYFLEDGTPYVVGKDGRMLTKFKGYKEWKNFNMKKSS